MYLIMIWLFILIGGSTSEGNIGFYTRSAARLSIDGGTGNIGLGITPDASYKVKLGGTMMINTTNPGIQYMII